MVAADPRPVVLLNLPFGFKDGLSSHGCSTSLAQYFQTVHEKPILGGIFRGCRPTTLPDTCAWGDERAH